MVRESFGLIRIIIRTLIIIRVLAKAGNSLERIRSGVFYPKILSGSVLTLLQFIVLALNLPDLFETLETLK